MESLKPSTNELRHLISQFHDSGIDSLAPIEHQGEWSSAFEYSTMQGDHFVLRLSNLREDFDKDSFAAKNFTSSSLPIPSFLNMGEAFGGYFAITKRAIGKPIDTVSQDEMSQLLPTVLNLLNALRMTDISKTKGFGKWNVSGNAPFSSWEAALLDIESDGPEHRLSGWKVSMLKVPGGKEHVDRAVEKMSSLLPYCPNRRYLVHSDLLHYNLLTKGAEITALLDWGSSFYGDFLYELAWFTYFLPWHDYMKHIDIKRAYYDYFKANGADLANFEERLRCYEIHIGLDSLAYCSFKKDFSMAQKMIQRTEEVMGK